MATIVSDALPDTVSIRSARKADAAAVAELNGQLGYPAAVEEVRERLSAISRITSQTVFVACLGKDVVGWIDVAITRHLQSRPFALIGGLVVKDDHRGMRIGRRLCEAAEGWAREMGVGVVRVTSRSTRADAHRFYLRDGYTQVKISYVFEKAL
ncbi:MAG TPA: GNAT family N-acetyltransferase [Acidobacteriaceae bacterium]|nr:GNAT family N-acetyltransferase [Acidobacteriaceae bacterium]